MEIITFNSLPSTNEYLLNLSKKSANSWTVIHALEQTAGKGYAENIWKTETNKNLTFSLLLKTSLSFQELIFLNQWVSYCIFTFLTEHTKDISIKWPNDIIVNNKKICGILIENFKKNNVMHSIIGIGLNINQTDFYHTKNATSLKLNTGIEYDILSILNEILTIFEKEYNKIENLDKNFLSTAFNKYLYRKDIKSVFKLDDKLVEGYIKNANNDGSLSVEVNGVTKNYLHKQIQLIY